MGYYDFLDALVSCPHCGWSGIGRGTRLVDELEDSFEYACPECSETLGTQFYPSRLETVTDPRADPADAMASLLYMQQQHRIVDSQLKSPDQLPSLKPPPEYLAWHVQPRRDGDREVVIKHGKRIIWRELSYHGNWERFAEVATLLQKKYPTLKDLFPTFQSASDLFGDWDKAHIFIKQFRDRMRGETDD